MSLSFWSVWGGKHGCVVEMLPPQKWVVTLPNLTNLLHSLVEKAVWQRKAEDGKKHQHVVRSLTKYCVHLSEASGLLTSLEITSGRNNFRSEGVEPGGNGEEEGRSYPEMFERWKAIYGTASQCLNALPYILKKRTFRNITNTQLFSFQSKSVAEKRSPLLVVMFSSEGRKKGFIQFDFQKQLWITILITHVHKF